jgi:quercetin dioxygenase-like cupin family protein
MYDRIFIAQDQDPIAPGFDGVAIRVLIGDLQNSSTVVLTTMEAGARIPAHRHSIADELVYVVSGDFIEDGKVYGPGTAFWCKAGTLHGPHESSSGCKLITQFSAPLDFEVAA